MKLRALQFLFLVLLLLLILYSWLHADNAKTVYFRNHASQPIYVSFVHPDGKDTRADFVAPGGALGQRTKPGHVFEISSDGVKPSTVAIVDDGEVDCDITSGHITVSYYYTTLVDRIIAPLLKLLDERQLQAVFTGVTNAAFIPSIVVNFHCGLAHNGVIGIMTMFTSTAYHVCESLDREFLGFNNGRWHHMDNIFAITSLMALILNFTQLPLQSTAYEIMNCSALSVAIVAQLMSPWDVLYTVVPLVSSLILLLLICMINRHIPQVGRRDMIFALLAAVFAAVCFVNGLDEQHDVLRIWHSCWHIGVGTFGFYATKASRPPGLKHKIE